jgi:excisionase family DNA binding protein
VAQYMTSRQLSERWGCDRGTVTKLARKGALAGMRVGLDWRFSLAAVEAYESAHTSAPADPEATPVAKTPSRAPSAPVALEGFTLPDDYVPVFPEAWGMTPEEAASRAAGRGRATGKEKRPSAVTKRR